MSIKGYYPEKAWTNLLAGTCEWTTAINSKGNRVFIKRFLSPKAPSKETSEKLRGLKNAECKKFEQKQKRLIDKLNKVSEEGSVIVNGLDFFQHDSCFFKVTEYCNNTVSSKELQKANDDKKLLFIKSLCYGLLSAHNHDIVHLDLKTDNVLVTKNGDIYIPKIIDWDAGFVESDVPSPEDISGDQAFASPEHFFYTNTGEGSICKKTDVFSLAITLYHLLTGKFPRFHSDYSYAGEAVLSKAALEFPDKIFKNDNMDVNIKDILKKMTELEVAKRYTLQEVFESLKGIEKAPLYGSGSKAKIATEPKKETVILKTSTLYGSMVSAKEEDKGPTLFGTGLKK